MKLGCAKPVVGRCAGSTHTPPAPLALSQGDGGEEARQRSARSDGGEDSHGRLAGNVALREECVWNF